MRPGRARSAAGLLSLVLTVLGASAGGDGPSPAPSPSPSPSPAPSGRPVSESVDRVVNRMEDAREDPCKKAKDEGRPCFPVSTTVRGEEFSVRKSLGLPDPEKGKPAPGGAPTVAEMQPYRPGVPHGFQAIPAPVVSFDPGCVAKGVLKSLKGRNDTYYLYRVRDVHGERVEMYDHKLEAETFQGDLAFLGKFEGECAALAAYRHEALKGAPAGPPADPASRPSPGPSATPRPNVTPSPG